jgi:hypothetical protein
MKSLLGVWRDSIRDSDLSRTAKSVAAVLSTYMDARGFARPGRATLAAGASVSDRTVDKAIDQLEAAGWLIVMPPKAALTIKAHVRTDAASGEGVEVPASTVMRRAGGKATTNSYQACLPETASELRSNEWQRAKSAQPKSEDGGLNSDGASHESSESIKESLPETEAEERLSLDAIQALLLQHGLSAGVKPL